MKAVLRPLFVGAISIAIAATSVIGSSSTALAAPPPLIVSWSLESPIYEGGTPTLTGTFGGGGSGHGPYTVDVDWLGNQVLESYSIDTLTVGVPFHVVKTEPYPNEVGPFTIVVYLNDSVATNRKNIQNVTVLNAAPSFESFGVSPSNPETGQQVKFTAEVKDSGANDTHTLTLSWGDDSAPTTTDLVLARSFTSEAHTYSHVGDYVVTATVTDDSLAASDPVTLTVTVHAPNQAPSLSFQVTPGPEGGESSLAISFADADALDTHTVSVAWGDGQTTDSGTLAASETTFNPKHTYADTGTFSFVVTLKDSASPVHTVIQPGEVKPTNVGPVLGALTLEPSAVVDHQEVTVSGAFTDPTGPGTTETFTLTVVWGDGTTPTVVPLGTTQGFSEKHTYTVPGSVTITATVTDANGGNGSSTANLVVGSSNHAPANLTFAVSGTGANVVIDAHFTDADASDTHTVSMTWGDGESAQPTVDFGTTTFHASHVYAESRTYTVSATVTDAAGATTDATTEVVVTIAGGSAADVLDEMSALVRNSDLDRNTERWLLKKIDDLKASLAYGNGQVCSASGTLVHILAFADRTIGHDQFVQLRALAAKLEAAAGCSSNGAVSPKVQKAATVTAKTVTPTTASPTTSASTPKKDTTAKPAKADLKATDGRNNR
jgi:PKD repeat protein